MFSAGMAWRMPLCVYVCAMLTGWHQS